MNNAALIEALKSWLEDIRKARQEFFACTGYEEQRTAQYEALMVSAINLLEYYQAENQALIEDTLCLSRTLEDNEKLQVEIERLQNEIKTKNGAMLEIFELKTTWERLARIKALTEVFNRLDEFFVGVCSSVVEDNLSHSDRILFGYNSEEVDEFLGALKKEMVGEQK